MRQLTEKRLVQIKISFMLRCIGAIIGLLNRIKIDLSSLDFPEFSRVDLIGKEYCESTLIPKIINLCISVQSDLRILNIKIQEYNHRGQ